MMPSVSRGLTDYGITTETKKRIRIVRPAKSLSDACHALPADAGSTTNIPDIKDCDATVKDDLICSNVTVITASTRTGLGGSTVAPIFSDKNLAPENYDAIDGRISCYQMQRENTECSHSEKMTSSSNAICHMAVESKDPHLKHKDEMSLDDALQNFALKKLKLIEEEQKQIFGKSPCSILSVDQNDCISDGHRKRNSKKHKKSHGEKYSKKHKKSHGKKYKKCSFECSKSDTIMQEQDCCAEWSKKRKKKSRRQKSEHRPTECLTSTNKANAASCKYEVDSITDKHFSHEVTEQRKLCSNDTSNEGVHSFQQYDRDFLHDSEPLAACHSEKPGKLSVRHRLHWNSVPPILKGHRKLINLNNSGNGEPVDVLHSNPTKFSKLHHKDKEETGECSIHKPGKQHHSRHDKFSSEFEMNGDHGITKTVFRLKNLKHSLQPAKDDNLNVPLKKICCSKCLAEDYAGMKTKRSRKWKSKPTKTELMQTMVAHQPDQSQHDQKSMTGKYFWKKETEPACNSRIGRGLCETCKNMQHNEAELSFQFSISTESVSEREASSVGKTAAFYAEAQLTTKSVDAMTMYDGSQHDEEFVPMKLCKVDDEDVISRIILSRVVKTEPSVSSMYSGKPYGTLSSIKRSKLVSAHTVGSKINGERGVADDEKDGSDRKQKDSNMPQWTGDGVESQPAVTDDAAGLNVSKKDETHASNCLGHTEHTDFEVASELELLTQRHDTKGAEVQSKSVSPGAKELAACRSNLPCGIENGNKLDSRVSFFKKPAMKLGLKITDTSAAVISLGIKSSRKTLEEGKFYPLASRNLIIRLLNQGT
jgi:hypothetical protein